MKEESNQPLLSVVLCTYNTERYIAEAIESVLAQTYTNFEFIIWDDGSTDGTKSIVESYKDERIRYFYHENTGLGMALRLACAEAKGKYIARMDSDDVCLPERFEREVEYLENNANCVLISSSVFYIDEKGVANGRTFPCSNDKVLKSLIRRGGNMIVHPMTMMRRDAYERAGGYLPIKKSQDVLFWSRLAKQGDFYVCPTPLGKYRLLVSSLDHSSNPYKPVLMQLLVKMVNDDNVVSSDIEMYNHIFQYSKSVKQNLYKGKSLEVIPSHEQRIYDLISPIIGRNTAEKAIVKFKDIYYRFKLRNDK